MSDTVIQPSRRETSERVVVASNTGSVRWCVRGMSYDKMQRYIAAYNVRSIRNENTFVICSTNIWLEVSSLGADFDSRLSRDDAAQCNEVLDRWRARKSADDTASYNQSTESLYQTAISNNYNASEQHVVWAMGASGRTGGRVPPEFFMENEAFGGTAGNGPRILDKGGAGQERSTIAMAHDTDWMLGRMTAVGPLRRLYDLNPHAPHHYARMGSVGLFNASQVNWIANVDGTLREPAVGSGRGRPTASQQRMIDANRSINAALDACAAEEIYYRDGLTSNFLAQGKHGWRVFYTPEGSYASFDNSTYLWNGDASALGDKNEIRAYNESYAPYFKQFKAQSTQSA